MLISNLLTMGSTLVKHSVLNVKAFVGALNQEMALVGAFSVIVKTDGSFAALLMMLICPNLDGEMH